MRLFLNLLSALEWAALLGAGVALIWAICTLIGYRKGEHPHCRACGFDLFGLLSKRQTCPECGADVTDPKAVQIGQTVRTWRHVGLAAFAVPFLIAAMIGLGGYREELRLRPYHFKVAVTSGDLATVDALLQQHPQFAKGEFYTSPTGPSIESKAELIEKAVFGGNPTVLKRLLAGGILREDPQAILLPGLYRAAEFNRPTMAALLMEAGAEPTPAQADPQWGSPLHRAVRHQATPVIHAMLEHGADVNAVRRCDMDDASAPIRDYTPLLVAARYRWLEGLKLLLDKGADIHAGPGSAVLLHELGQDYTATLLLLERGADLTSRDARGRLPFAPAKGEEEVWGLQIWTAWIRQLEERDELAKLEAALARAPEVLTWQYEACDGTLLHSAVHRRWIEGVQILLAHGAQINARRHKDGLTPLHIAASHLSDEILLALIEAGADIHAISKGGQTPLHLACDSSGRATIQTLLAHGASPLAQDENGLLPLHWGILERARPVVPDLLRSYVTEPDIFIATAEGDREAVAAMLADDPSLVLKADNPWKHTPLFVAVIWDRPAIVDLLVEQGADINARNRGFGTAGESTPLHVALNHAEVDIATRLIRHGADVTLRNAHGMTALHCAAWRNDTELIDMALAHGADLNARNSRDQTALDIARDFKQQRVVAHLEGLGARTGDQMVATSP